MPEPTMGSVRDIAERDYLEMQLGDPKTGEQFIVTIQRVLGKTPRQLRLGVVAAAREAARLWFTVNDAPSEAQFADYYKELQAAHRRLVDLAGEG